MDNKMDRRAELHHAMPSFSQEQYSKKDLLLEMKKLQAELVQLTFNDDHAECAKLQIWDVYNHLANVNTMSGNVAGDLLQCFKEECKKLGNAIAGECTGNQGEKAILWQLRAANTPRTVLQNVELSLAENKTELDIIVFTAKAVFVVEVKNTKQTILIDERGNYCRVKDGEPIFDKNIAEKMNDKIILLRNVLQTAGFTVPNIVSMVVFANPAAAITNHYPYIQHCSKADLPHIIDGYVGADLYSKEEIAQMVSAVNAAKYTGLYRPSLDVHQIKQTFIELIIALERAADEKSVEELGTEDVVRTADSPQTNVAEDSPMPRWRKLLKFALPAIPAVGAVVAFSINRWSRR